MTNEQLQIEFEQFITNLKERVTELEINLNEMILDHACYRAADQGAFQVLLGFLKENSRLFTMKIHHERQFYCFFLKRPLMDDKQQVFYIEFSEPGGSDDYLTSFQHVEWLSNRSWQEMVNQPEKLEKFLFKGKFGDEEYLKWPDKMVVKLTSIPLITKSLMDNESIITVV